MKSDSSRFDADLFRCWLRTTCLGWWLGLVLVVLLALLWRLFGDEAQFVVGIGMGGGVGCLQARLLARWLKSPGQWWEASTVGIGFPDVLYDLGRLAGVAVPFSTPLYVVAGSLLTGVWQWQLLRPFSKRAGWWVPACVVGWGLSGGLIALGDSGVAGPWGTFFPILAIFGGGIILGTVSGKVIVWIFNKPSV